MLGKVPKLDNLNFSIKKGELIAIIGEVGSGKVSLMYYQIHILYKYIHYNIYYYWITIFTLFI